MATVFSADKENDPDVLAMIGASAALHVSHIPFLKPTGAVRVGRVDGEFVVMPTTPDMEESDLDLIVAGTRDAITMIEGFAREMPEEDMPTPIMFAHEQIVQIIDLIEELREKAGLGQKEPPPAAEPNPLDGILPSKYYDELKQPQADQAGKLERYAKVDELKAKLKAEVPARPKASRVHRPAVQPGVDGPGGAGRPRADPGRQAARRPRASSRSAPSDCEVGVLPRTHGSAIFQRGETQALVTTTLGTVARRAAGRGARRTSTRKKFMLDYNFPPFSVGECKPIRGPGRREIGHGMLAERSLKAVIPPPTKFPYTIRARLRHPRVERLVDHGVGLRRHAGADGRRRADHASRWPASRSAWSRTATSSRLLTDIMGDEDHFGDMDFKVAGTAAGITGIQLDLKIDGIDEEIIAATLEQAREARTRDPARPCSRRCGSRGPRSASTPRGC